MFPNHHRMSVVAQADFRGKSLQGFSDVGRDLDPDGSPILWD